MREGYWRPESDPLIIAEQLLKRRYSANQRPPSDITSAVYAFFLHRGSALSPVACARAGLLYVGMTDSCLAIRNHFIHENSGFSTLRRTLGAVLKAQLELQPIPRSAGNSKTNVSNFRFRLEDEQRLTKWMRKHLTYNYVAVEGEVKEIERQLIRDLEPPLNLIGWPNPFRSELRDRRKLCRVEAERHRP
jgi:hypothetical protein